MCILIMKQSGRELRSTNQYLLQIPKTGLNTYGDAAFSVAGPNEMEPPPRAYQIGSYNRVFQIQIEDTFV